MRSIGLDDLARFLIGGAIVAAVPFIARTMTPVVAAVLALVPAPLLLGFAFLGMESGPASVSKATVTALYALPTLVVFLLLTYWLLRRTGSVPIALVGGLIGWSASAWLFVAITASRHA